MYVGDDGCHVILVHDNLAICCARVFFIPDRCINVMLQKQASPVSPYSATEHMQNAPVRLRKAEVIKPEWALGMDCCLLVCPAHTLAVGMAKNTAHFLSFYPS